MTTLIHRYTDTQIHTQTDRDLDIMTTAARRAAAVKILKKGMLSDVQSARGGKKEDTVNFHQVGNLAVSGILN